MKQLCASITFRPDVTREQAVEALYAIIRVLDLPNFENSQEGPNQRGLVAPTPEQLVGHLLNEQDF